MSDAAQPSLLDDGKAPEAFRTIGEVAKALGIRQHVLRYWEDQFPMLRPVKRSGSRRYYRPEDVRLLETIDRLVHHEGYTLRGARQAIEGGLRDAKSGNGTAPPSPPSPSAGADAEVIAKLRTIRAHLAQALED